MVNDQYLTATIAFQILIQSTADVTDCRDEGEKVGLIKQWMSYDESIAIVLAWRIITEYEQNISPKLMMSLLMNYCRDSLTDAYADFACQLLQKENTSISQDVLKNNQYSVLIDIEKFIISGRRVGYKSSRNPFREPFSTQWQIGLAG